MRPAASTVATRVLLLEYAIGDEPEGPEWDGVPIVPPSVARATGASQVTPLGTSVMSAGPSNAGAVVASQATSGARHRHHRRACVIALLGGEGVVVSLPTQDR